LKHPRAGPKSGPKTSPSIIGVNDWGFYPDNISPDGGTVWIEGWGGISK